MAKPFTIHALACPTCGAKHEAKGNLMRGMLHAAWTKRARAQCPNLYGVSLVVSPDGKTWRVFRHVENARTYCRVHGWAIERCMRRVRVHQDNKGRHSS